MIESRWLLLWQQLQIKHVDGKMQFSAAFYLDYYCNLWYHKHAWELPHISVMFVSPPMKLQFITGSKGKNCTLQKKINQFCWTVWRQKGGDWKVPIRLAKVQDWAKWTINASVHYITFCNFPQNMSSILSKIWQK